MAFLIAGLVIFFGTHFFSAFRARGEGEGLVGRIGYLPYMGLISLGSLAGLVLMIWGYGAARPSEILYQAPEWGRHVNLALMLPAIILLVAAYVPSGHIKALVKHPMLAALKVWALGHLLANGELNSVLLFGSFLVFGVVDRIAVKRRGDNGPAPDAPKNVVGDVAAVIVGVAAYLAITYYLHPILFGVPAVI
ncbi:MAG: NnrU family protein [Pseudomonadota bacterium]